jgi:pimeloyl-ACP methyl ester carboxylesterase
VTSSNLSSTLPDGFRRDSAHVNGVNLSYLIGGAGPALVLLHGWPQTAMAWERMLKPLSDQGFTVIAPDLRGTGESERATDGYDKDNQSEDMRALLRHLGLPVKVRLMGHDIGGMVAFSWARRHPEEVERLGLMELAVPGFGLEEAMDVAKGGRWHFGLFMTPDVPELLFNGHEREFFEWWFNRMAGKKEPFTKNALDTAALAYTGLDALRCGFEHYRTLLADGVTNREWGEEGGNLAMPTMAVGGELAVGTRLADRLRPIAPRIATVVLSGSGHFLPEESPDELLTHVIPFLK